MNALVQELDRQLSHLDPETAARVERLVRDALALAEDGAPAKGSPGGPQWPPGYFDRTAGSLAGERFDRAEQGAVPDRGEW